MAFSRQRRHAGGFRGERPQYLFEHQLAGLPRYDRQADYWIFLLAEFISSKTGMQLDPILPRGLPGAVIITGDDDQAYLEKYEEQLNLLHGIPVTYFLHPQTRHTKRKPFKNEASL